MKDKTIDYCHFANIGVEVLLFIVPRELNDSEKGKRFDFG